MKSLDFTIMLWVMLHLFKEEESTINGPPKVVSSKWSVVKDAGNCSSATLERLQIVYSGDKVIKHIPKGLRGDKLCIIALHRKKYHNNNYYRLTVNC